MKIDFNFNLKSLEGEDLKDPSGKVVNAGQVLAVALANSKFKEIDSLKAWEKGKQIYAKEIIDLDTTDQEAFKKAIKEELNFPSQIEAQILEAFSRPVKPVKEPTKAAE
jgi:hypothetical protein